MSVYGKKIAVIAVGNPAGEVGGAERFYRGVTRSLCEAGADAKIVWVISDESCFEKIEETYLRFYDLDLSAFDGVISTKAPAYMVRHPNHISYLQHTMRVFYDMFEVEFPNPWDDLIRQRDLIQKLDTLALTYPRTKKIVVIGNEVRNRLIKYNGLDADVVYQNLITNDQRNDSDGDYIFLPGRLHRWKRVDLAINAMKLIDDPVRLVISGTGEDEDYFRELAGNDERIQFVGRVSEEELVDYYANCLAVAFVPVREDFGLVTIEAFRSSKPVLTCVDSGEPTYIVRDSETGFVTEPTPEAIAEKFSFLWKNRDRAKQMGEAGFKSVAHITWANVADKLLTAFGFK